jgi:superfamily II DNA/RNA helicase
VIVFVKTKLDCHRLCLLLRLFDIEAGELHGGLTQVQVNSNKHSYIVLKLY